MILWIYLVGFIATYLLLARASGWIPQGGHSEQDDIISFVLVLGALVWLLSLPVTVMVLIRKRTRKAVAE